MDLVVGGELFHWRGPAPFHFVAVADDVAAVLASVSGEVSYGWGMIPVTARCGATTWTTALWPKDGTYLIPVKNAVRTAERLDLGDEVTVHLKLDV